MLINRNKIDFDTLRFRKYGMKIPTRKKNHPVNGLDIETYRGYAKLITDSDGNYIFPKSIDDALAFLTRKSLRSHHNFFFNIRFDFQAIIKLFDRESINILNNPVEYYDYKIHKEDKKRLIELYKTSELIYKDYKIKYIPKKLLSITKSGHVHKFYDVNNFYESSLDECVTRYLGKEKNVEHIDRPRLNKDLQYWKDNPSNIKKYCVSDSVLAKELGVLLQKEVIHLFGFPAQQYLSKASLSKEYFRRKCDINDTKNTHKPALAFAFNSYHGGRFEIIKRGYFKHAELLDINSAYPYHISKLVDYSGSRWYKVSEPDLDSLYGFYFCEVDVPYDTFTPLPFILPVEATVYPYGKFMTTLTKNEIIAYSKYIDIDVKIGYENHGKSEKYLFKDAIDTLYTVKKETPKTHYKYDLIKKIMNSLYGAFYEKTIIENIRYVGKLFNPVYASEVTANTRIQLFEQAIKHANHVIGFATDSILYDTSIDATTNDKIGGWGVDGSGETIVLRSGIYKIGGKLKSRGFGRKSKIKTPYGTFNSIFDYILEQPSLTEYEVWIERPVNLGEALLHPKITNVKDINIWKRFPYKININRDVKRLWNDEFENGGELFTKMIDSSPIPISWIERAQKLKLYQMSQQNKNRAKTMFNKSIKQFRDTEESLDVDSQLSTKREKDMELLGEARRWLR